MMARLSQVTIRVRLNDFNGGIGIDDWHDVSVSNFVFSPGQVALFLKHCPFCSRFLPSFSM